MGRAFVRALREDGAQVGFCDLDPLQVSRVVSEEAGEVVGFVADVSDEVQVEALVRDAWSALGGIQVWINNAGIVRDGLLVRHLRDGHFAKMSLSDWRAVIDVDLTAPFLCTRELALASIAAGASPLVVVNMSSASRHGNPGQSNYSAAKAGLVADTRLWAQELARHHVRVVAIAPGFVDTPMLQEMREDVLQLAMRKVPLGRAARPEEIYQAVRFAIECDYVNGTCIEVDGGLRF